LRLAPTESMILGYRGWIRFKQGRVEEGLKDYSMAAELGDAYSQFQRGKQLFYGVPPTLAPNRSQALLWLTKAAEQGNEGATQFLKQVGEKQ
jgi:TPR repeat protein